MPKSIHSVNWKYYVKIIMWSRLVRDPLPPNLPAWWSNFFVRVYSKIINTRQQNPSKTWHFCPLYKQKCVFYQEAKGHLLVLLYLSSYLAWTKTQNKKKTRSSFFFWHTVCVIFHDTWSKTCIYPFLKNFSFFLNCSRY